MHFIEDLYREFVSLVHRFDEQDEKPIADFLKLILNNQPLTEKQGSYVIRLMKKYSHSVNHKFDNELLNPVWKNTFRVISTEKSIRVESNEVIMKFPYSTKTFFLEEFNATVMDTMFMYTGLNMPQTTIWSTADTKDYRINVNAINLIHLNDFVRRNGFDIESSFDEVISDVEEIWDQEADCTPCAIVSNNEVVLANATSDVDAYWEEHKTSEVPINLFLAKSMGFIYNGIPKNTIEQISSEQGNGFWTNNNLSFLELCAAIPGKICFLVDRASRVEDWFLEFVDAVNKSAIPISSVKVASKINTKYSKEITDTIKEYKMTTKVNTAKIVICFSQLVNSINLSEIQIIATNNLYQPSSVLVSSLLETHPCVIYVSDYKPHIRRNSLVNLHNYN